MSSIETNSSKKRTIRNISTSKKSEIGKKEYYQRDIL
jgi:hypothetical protein